MRLCLCIGFQFISSKSITTNPSRLVAFSLMLHLSIPYPTILLDMIGFSFNLPAFLLPFIVSQCA